MKKVFKISIIFMVVILQLISMPTIVKADNIFNPAETFIKKGQDKMNGGKIEKKDPTGQPAKDLSGQTIMVNQAGLNETTLKNANATLFNVLLALGIALAVIIGAILGIKFMIASVEEKAQIKELLVPYIVGCIVVFGAFGIWKIVIELGQNL